MQPRPSFSAQFLITFQKLTIIRRSDEAWKSRSGCYEGMFGLMKLLRIQRIVMEGVDGPSRLTYDDGDLEGWGGSRAVKGVKAGELSE